MLSNLECVQIELHSMCNRMCPWCPNKEYHRDFYEELPEDTYLALLEDLKKNNFKGMIFFSGFNEPMLNADLLKVRAKQVREMLPDVKLKANTNGDFLTKENLSGLELDYLNINDYDCNGVEWCKRRMAESGIMAYNLNKDEKYIIVDGLHSTVSSIKYRVKWPVKPGWGLEDRAGYFKPGEEITFNERKIKWRNNHKLRTHPCIEPAVNIAITYNGEVYPCCHHNPLIESHRNNLMGNINDEPLSQIFYSEKFSQFRETMLSNDYNLYPDTCKYCQKRFGYQDLNERALELKEIFFKGGSL